MAQSPANTVSIPEEIKSNGKRGRQHINVTNENFLDQYAVNLFQKQYKLATEPSERGICAVLSARYENRIASRLHTVPEKVDVSNLIAKYSAALAK